MKTPGKIIARFATTWMCQGMKRLPAGSATRITISQLRYTTTAFTSKRWAGMKAAQECHTQEHVKLTAEICQDCHEAMIPSEGQNCFQYVSALIQRCHAWSLP